MTIELHYKDKTTVEVFTPHEEVTTDWIGEFLLSVEKMIKAGVIPRGEDTAYWPRV